MHGVRATLIADVVALVIAMVLACALIASLSYGDSEAAFFGGAFLLMLGGWRVAAHT